MLKKIDKGKVFVKEHEALFRCPLCHQRMAGNETGLICAAGHRFDVSKKGTLYFLTKHIASDYDQQLFEARQRMIKSGMYQPLMEQLAGYLGKEETILDVGCGEGSFLNDLLERQPATAIGFDIAKEGVYLATNQPAAAFWCVADLTNLPFADNSFTTILNIFSPSNYQEFQRVLQPGGRLLKVVPGAGYLRELRQAFYPDDQEKQSYSNQPVLDKFRESYPEAEIKELNYVFPIPEERRLDLLEMSPLEWAADPAIKEQLMAAPLSEITIDLILLVTGK